MDETRISIELERDEALVLSSLLSRWIESEHGRTIGNHTRDDAEIWALNALHCLLEKHVSETFDPKYEKVIREACEQIRDRNGGPWPWKEQSGRE
jgi:hypothetical protein